MGIPDPLFAADGLKKVLKVLTLERPGKRYRCLWGS